MKFPFRPSYLTTILVLSFFYALPSISKSTISDKEALEIANKTEEVKAFIKIYGSCDGCNPTYASEKTKALKISLGIRGLTGCIEYEVGPGAFLQEVFAPTESKKPFAKTTWLINYWVSDACSFRYYSESKNTRLLVSIDQETGEILDAYPKLRFISDKSYCEKDEDCRCISGSGVPYIGCSNYFHAYSTCCGNYDCNFCKCANNRCIARDSQDPIDSLVLELSSFPMWQNGLYPSILLPKGAKQTEVIAECFKKSGFDKGYVKNHKIIAIKSVVIKYAFPNDYFAALVDTDIVGRRIVLFRYEGTSTGWWTRVYKQQNNFTKEPP